MSYSDTTLMSPAAASRLTRGRDRAPALIIAQPGRTPEGRTVMLRVVVGGQRIMVLEIPKAEWDRLNRDANTTP